ncbi:MAG TPA: OmpA family protein [Candidatus Avamphibacillus sp.]|nr:OmpA family protein [Candidatus Avamphibacillus sp.]
MRKSLSISILLFVFFILVACTDDEASNAKEENENDTNGKEQQMTDEKDKEIGEEDKKENDKTTLGNLEVMIGGKVTVEEDRIRIEGESNLLPGSKIMSSGQSSTFADADFIDSATVNDDGTFLFEFPGKSKNRKVTLKLSNSSDEIDEHYGENLENVTGSQVYMTDTHGEFEVRVDLNIDVNKELPYSYDIEIPNWGEKPDDFGNPEVWMEAEVDNDHNYLYFTGRSNLMEGAQIGGNLRFADGGIEPFSHGFTRINPDGSFKLKVPYHSLRPGMYMPIVYEPNRNSWEDVVDLYGEKGENFEGDLVVKDGDVKGVVLNVPIDVPEINPPEEVDLTFKEEEVKMQVPDDLLFDFDDSTLKKEAMETLDDIIIELENLETDTPIHINGHTDNQGDPDYNLNLSEERAEAVWEYIQENGDIDTLNVHVEGFGETKPITSNDDSDGQERNRRVEIIINPQ